LKQERFQAIPGYPVGIIYWFGHQVLWSNIQQFCMKIYNFWWMVCIGLSVSLGPSENGKSLAVSC